eukprot:COSAG01_NODE_287_length_19408_cov_231.791703_4_plen_174_part_00
MSDGATAAAAGAGGSAEGPVPPPSKGKGEDSGGWEEELAALRSQVARLSRRVVEQGDELELERGRLVMAASELAEARRQSAELQSQLTAARASGAGSGAGQARTPRPPSWSPAGSARRSKTGARPRSPLTGTRTLAPAAHLRPASVCGPPPSLWCAARAQSSDDGSSRHFSRV